MSEKQSQVMGTTPLFRSLEHAPLQGVMTKLKLIWNEISYPKGYVLINRDKIERDVYLRTGGSGAVQCFYIGAFIGAFDNVRHAA